jgi:hypothetical protein
MPKVTLRPAIASDLTHVIGEPLPCRIRAITALVDDRVIGLGGIAFLPGGPPFGFVQLAPAPAGSDAEAKRYPVAFHRAGLTAMRMIRDAGLTEVLATADPTDATAMRWLLRLGFEPSESHRVPGKALFAWRRERADHAFRTG